MGHRLSKIYTRTGDDGTTGLANSALGLLLAEKDLPPPISASITRIQHELFEIGAELSLPGYRQITAEHVTRLEQDLDALNDELPPLKEFVLPGGTRAAALCHVART